MMFDLSDNLDLVTDVKLSFGHVFPQNSSSAALGEYYQFFTVL